MCGIFDLYYVRKSLLRVVTYDKIFSYLSVLVDEVEFISAHKGKLQIEAITLIDTAVTQHVSKIHVSVKW